MSIKCEHNIRKSRCDECGGSELCEHKKRKSRCKECDGSELCEHKKLKYFCKECNGSAFCEHNRIKSTCKECGGGSICEHNRHRSKCRECGGGSICEHNKRRERCKICKGSSICKHLKLKFRCRECDGSAFCNHNKDKNYCKECGGWALCKSSWCETRVTKKYDGYCFNCFIHLFPEQPNSRNYKTKEKATIDYILEQFPIESYTWITDKKIQDGCSRKRPDILLDLGYQVVIVEVDENQHTDYDCSCENKRLMELSQDVDHRSLVFIRFNPDEYITKEGKVTSCWSLNGQGICTVKKTKQKEWTERLEALKYQVEYWLENKTEKTVEIIQLFYDCD